MTTITPMANKVQFNTKKILTLEKHGCNTNIKVSPISKTLKSSYSLDVNGYLVS
jgi:hypothetical protein